MAKKVSNSRKDRRKKANRQIYTVLLVIVVAIVIVVTLMFGYRSLLKKQKAYEENIAELNTELKDLEDSNKQLSDEMNNMDSKEFKEKIAREKLGMIGEDEVLLKESEDGSTGRGTADESETEAAESGDGAESSDSEESEDESEYSSDDSEDSDDSSDSDYSDESDYSDSEDSYDSSYD